MKRKKKENEKKKEEALFEEINDSFRLSRIKGGSVSEDDCDSCCGGDWTTASADVNLCCESMVSGDIG